MNVLHHLAMQSEALVILLQETHCTDAEKLVLPNNQLAGSSLSRKHGLATFVHERLRYTLLDQSSTSSEVQWLCVDVDGYKIVNVYKPPPTRLRILDLPVFPHSCLYAGDFNCRHVDWDYDDNSPDGECLAGWASVNCLALLYNAKDAASFYSGRWNTGTNPDLAFASVGPNSRLPDRRVLDKFPRSQHRPSLITPPRFSLAVPSMPVKRWNFRKTKWSHYIALTNKFAKTLLPPDSLDVDAAYQDFYNTIKKAAKKTIPRGYRNNYIPCWDAECESLYKTFLQSPQGDWKDLEGTLSQDMSTLSAYLQTWRLKLSQTKTITAAFHLNNREAKRELKVYNNWRLLSFCPIRTYLGVKLDRSLTVCHHLVAWCKKLSSRVTLLRRLVGSGWSAGAKTLRKATLSLVYSIVEYCAPVWCRSAHTRLIDSVLNNVLGIVTGCLRPTPTVHLPVLSGIQSAELCQLGAKLFLAYRGSLDSNHILHGLLSGSSDTHQVRLRSRHPFVPGARNLLENLARLGICASEWTNYKWNAEYCENASRLRAFVPKTGARPVGMGLTRAAWVKLNRLRTGVGQFYSSMHKWGLALSPNCKCGASE